MQSLAFKQLFEIVDHIHDLFVIFDNQGKILDCNHEAANILKFPKTQLIGSSIFEIVAKGQKEKAKKLFTGILKGQTYSGNMPLESKNGEIVYVESYVGSELYENDRIYYLLAKDLTKFVKSQERFSKFFADNPMPMFITRQNDGMIIEANQAMLTFMKMKSSQMLGKTTIEIGLIDSSIRKSIIAEYIKNNNKLVNYEVIVNKGKTNEAIISLFSENIDLDGEKCLLSVFNDQTNEIKFRQSLRDSIEDQKLISQIAEIASLNISIETKINKILVLISSHFHSCDLYIFEFALNKYAYFFSQDQKLELPMYKIVKEDELELKKMLLKHGYLNARDLVECSGDIRRLLNPYKAKSVMILPIISQSKMVAFIGFSQCMFEVDSQENDIQKLETIADLLSSIYEKYEKDQFLEEKAKENEDAKNAIMNILEDVELEKTKTENLAKELEKFQLAVNQASDHIVISDINGRIIYANTAVERITGFSLEEVIGRTPGELWGGLMDKKFYENFWHIIKIEKKPFSGEFLNKRKNGQQYYAQSNVTPILDENNNVVFFVGLERDISKIKEIDRMKTEFISIASHQLRTPLSAMKWYLELLLAGDAGKLNEQQMDFVQNLNTSNERMIDLVNALLNVSRIESGRIIIEPHPVNVKDLIESVISETLVKANEKKMQIKLEVQKGLPLVNLDMRLIRNALINLLTNAIKYSPEGTEIIVGAKKAEKFVIFSVLDHGYGIPKADQDKVFNKFYRGTNIIKFDTNGNGIGLYLVKSIIDSSGGTIWFESKLNKGTTFWFKLPIIGVEAKKGEVTLEANF